MRTKKITSLIAIALTIVIANVTIGNEVYAAEISSNNNIKVETSTQTKLKNADAKEFLKIVDHNITFSNGHYSFNKPNAIKSGLSLDNANSVDEIAKEFNRQIDEGIIEVSSDGKALKSVKIGNQTTIQSYSNDGLTLVYDRYIGSSVCSGISDILYGGGGVFTLASYLVLSLPNVGPIASRITGAAGAVMTIGGAAFSTAARNGGVRLRFYAQTDSGKIISAFLR